jgi:abortive infection bacteriophage resistance protein
MTLSLWGDRNLHDRERQILAGFYRLPKKTAIQMLHSLSHLRNVCAHHSRVWNRNFTISVTKYKKYEDIFENSSNTLYAYLVVMQIFVSKISPSSKWLDKLDSLIGEYDIDIYRMGFPENWKSKLESMK